MNQIISVPETAKQYYQLANNLRMKRHFLDALVMYDRACALEPSNREFAVERQQLRIYAAGFGGLFHKPKLPNLRDDHACRDGCCEVCLEGCGEGCCEGICTVVGEGCCDGCDCS